MAFHVNSKALRIQLKAASCLTQLPGESFCAQQKPLPMASRAESAQMLSTAPPGEQAFNWPGAGSTLTTLVLSPGEASLRCQGPHLCSSRDTSSKAQLFLSFSVSWLSIFYSYSLPRHESMWGYLHTVQGNLFTQQLSTGHQALVSKKLSSKEEFIPSSYTFP